MTDRIEGRVAQILTARELVINKGSADGVGVGVRFAVLNRRGTDIKDPDTGEFLGSVEIEKVLVKVVRVDEHLSVARTFRTYREGGGALWALSALQGSPPRTVYETLKTDERRLKDELDEKESYVKIGDPVVQVIGEEFDDNELQSDPLLRRSVCAAGQPACPQVSRLWAITLFPRGSDQVIPQVLAVFLFYLPLVFPVGMTRPGALFGR